MRVWLSDLHHPDTHIIAEVQIGQGIRHRFNTDRDILDGVEEAIADPPSQHHPVGRRKRGKGARSEAEIAAIRAERAAKRQAAEACTMLVDPRMSAVCERGSSFSTFVSNV